jgi:hypothetical protein
MMGDFSRGLSEFPLVAVRAVDHGLIVIRQPGSPAALVLAGDTAALDALEAVRVDGRRFTHRRGQRTTRRLPLPFLLPIGTDCFSPDNGKAPFPGLSFVGTAGFEPAASCSQSRRATRLRYVPSDLV